MKVLKAVATVLLAGTICGSAMSGPVTIGFQGIQALQSPIDGSITSNYETAGYRISPECHIDFYTSTQYGLPFSDEAGIGWDAAGCYDNHNANYLGTPSSNYSPGIIYIDRAGALFDLVSLVGLGRDSPFGPTYAKIKSSKGGNIDIALPYATFAEIDFAGDLWKDVAWITLSNGGGGPVWLMDSITLSTIPEPMTVSLIGLALGCAALARYRKR